MVAMVSNDKQIETADSGSCEDEDVCGCSPSQYYCGLVVKREAREIQILRQIASQQAGRSHCFRNSENQQLSKFKFITF